MTMKPRSFRVTDETVDRMKAVANETGRPMHRIMAAAIAYFDPANEKSHMEFLEEFEKGVDTVDIASKIKDMPPEERDKLLEMLSQSK
ncbi:MAG: ribbon-helix-helix domain-containing protein [Hyphomonas sp.]|nr:ribbon-helix-helix domain-containing protein [Hyphomonas sp.]